MRQLKALLLASLALVFVAGVGTGAFVGSLAAGTPEPALDRRVGDFTKVYSLSPTQVRQLREILYDFDHNKRQIQQPTAEQARELRALEAKSRDRIRRMLTEEQLMEYDRRAARR